MCVLRLFLELFTAEVRGRYRDYPHALCPHTCIVSSIITITYQSGTFVTTEETTLTRHVTDLGFTLGAVGLSKSIVRSIHHYSIIESIFIDLKYLYFTYSSFAPHLSFFLIYKMGVIITDLQHYSWGLAIMLQGTQQACNAWQSLLFLLSLLLNKQN